MPVLIPTRTCKKCMRLNPPCGFFKHSNGSSWRSDCADCSADRIRKYNQMMRTECFNTLGSKCVLCEETEREFLTIDHINMDGAIERESLHPDQIKKRILNDSSCRSKYRVLCRNCNDEIDLTRPKNLPTSIRSEQKRIKRFKIRQQVMTLFGGSCECCEESGCFRLTIDHINNDGASFPAPRGGADLYKKILDNVVNQSLFQLLCWNCNFSKYLGHGVCAHQRKYEVT